MRKEVGSGSRFFLVFFPPSSSPSTSIFSPSSSSFFSSESLSLSSSSFFVAPSSSFFSSTSMASASSPASSASLAFFLANLALFFAVVDKVTVSTRFFFSSFFSSRRLGYANTLGLELHWISKFLGYLKSPFRPIVSVGVRARLIMCIMGYQCQCCSQRARPTALVILVKPFLEPKSREQFLPPASMIPVPRMAPILVNVLWCLSLMVELSFSRKDLILRRLQVSDCCM
mmetsp:Transcript_28151/g.62679  ORF Transcript_28151/g.62679 Transcript_28151/m.62679 type:complete len:229 (-) Transcript_28151:1342-2028(-)